MTLRQIIRLRSIAFCLVCHHNMLFPPAHSKGCKIREFSFQSNFPYVYTLFPCTVIIPLKRCASVFLPLFLSQNSRWFLFFPSQYIFLQQLFIQAFIPTSPFHLFSSLFLAGSTAIAISTPSVLPHFTLLLRTEVLYCLSTPLIKLFFRFFLFYPFTLSPSNPPQTPHPLPSSPDHV